MWKHILNHTKLHRSYKTWTQSRKSICLFALLLARKGERWKIASCPKSRLVRVSCRLEPYSRDKRPLESWKKVHAEWLLHCLPWPCIAHGSITQTLQRCVAVWVGWTTLCGDLACVCAANHNLLIKRKGRIEENFWAVHWMQISHLNFALTLP